MSINASQLMDVSVDASYRLISSFGGCHNYINGQHDKNID